MGNDMKRHIRIHTGKRPYTFGNGGQKCSENVPKYHSEISMQTHIRIKQIYGYTKRATPRKKIIVKTKNISEYKRIQAIKNKPKIQNFVNLVNFLRSLMNLKLKKNYDHSLITL